jgi:hypothetical protein
MVRHGTQNKGFSSHSSFNSDSRFMNGLNLTAAEDGQTQVAEVNDHASGCRRV